MNPLFRISPNHRLNPGYSAVTGIGKRASSAILAGCIAALLTPHLSADTVTGRNGSTNTSNYTTSRSNSLIINSSNNPGFTMTGRINGNGSVTKSGAGTVTWAGSTANTYTKQTIVTAGTLVLAKTPGVNAIIGDGISSSTIPDVVITGGELRLGADNQFDDSVYLQVATGGTFNANGHSDTFYNLVNLGGTVITGRGANLTLLDPTWNAGSNNIVNGGSTYNVIVDDNTAPANVLIINGGGNNVIHGSETYGVGADGEFNGKLYIGGPVTIAGVDGAQKIFTINADHQQGGALHLDADLSVTFSSGTASIANGQAYLADALTVDPNQSNLVDGTVNLVGGTRTFSVVNAGATFAIAPTITNGGLNKTGAGTMSLTGNNTFAGTTTVNNGKLVAAGTGGDKALGATSGIEVNSGGTLILNTANQVNTTATMNLNGGTLDLGNVSQGSQGTAGVGALTLTATSTLDFGDINGVANVIQFGVIGAHTFGSGIALNIADYDAGLDRLFFTGNMSDFTSKFAQNEVSFNGNLGYNAVSFGGGYEIGFGIVPVPEPTTILGAAGVLGFVGYRERRRLRGMWSGRIVPGVSFLGFLAFAGLSALVNAINSLTGRR